MQVDSETPAEVEEDDSLEARYARLLEEHNRQSAILLERNVQNPAMVQHRPGVVQAPADAAVAAQQLTVAPTYKLDKDTLRRALIEDDADAFEQVLGGLVSYVSQAMEAQQAKIHESVLLAIPGTARIVAQQEITMLDAVKNFYDSNKDLIPYQSVVGSITNELVAKEPNLTLQQTLEKVEKETRRRLGLKKQIAATEASGRGKPIFAKTSGSRRPGAPQLDDLRADIAAMQRAKY